MRHVAASLLLKCIFYQGQCGFKLYWPSLSFSSTCFLSCRAEVEDDQAGNTMSRCAKNCFHQLSWGLTLKHFYSCFQHFLHFRIFYSISTEDVSTNLSCKPPFSTSDQLQLSSFSKLTHSRSDFLSSFRVETFHFLLRFSKNGRCSKQTIV